MTQYNANITGGGAIAQGGGNATAQGGVSISGHVAGDIVIDNVDTTKKEQVSATAEMGKWKFEVRESGHLVVFFDNAIRGIFDENGYNLYAEEL